HHHLPHGQDREPHVLIRPDGLIRGISRLSVRGLFGQRLAIVENRAYSLNHTDGNSDHRRHPIIHDRHAGRYDGLHAPGDDERAVPKKKIGRSAKCSFSGIRAWPRSSPRRDMPFPALESHSLLDWSSPRLHASRRMPRPGPSPPPPGTCTFYARH
ncbi:MAG: hypothetical protein QG605_1992, partial [Euryarchaeota archaeon]|nr:hypothetical protein [Euryarchaeota archaeon]